MAKWIGFIKQAVRRYREFNNSLVEYCKAQRARRERAHELLESLSPASRMRFSDQVLIHLLDAGWHEGRVWSQESLLEFQNRFTGAPPPTALEVLREFGGLDIGLSGRTIQIGHIGEWLCSHRQKLTSLVGPTLHPIGETNIFADDGVGVHMDEEGRVFLDGPTGHDPPHDHRIEVMAQGFDFFLKRVFSDGPTPPLASWDYTESDAHDQQNQPKEIC